MEPIIERIRRTLEPDLRARLSVGIPKSVIPCLHGFLGGIVSLARMDGSLAHFSGCPASILP